MSSKTISAILWTLVSVNVITLVFGGLVTWLGYSIPARLKQIGLLPELVMTAGFASLVVACIGLGALNYSSYHALNVYGVLCTVFALLLILGIPENWYKSSQFAHTLLLDIIYFSLLLILLLLLSFSFTLAHYLRRKDQLALLLLEPNNQPQLSLSSSAQLQHQRHQFSQHQYRPFNNTNNICTCSPQRFLEIANTNNSFNAEESSNNGTKIVDSKWFPNSLMEDISAAATASLSRTNNLFVTSSRANNNNHNHRFANNQHHAIDCHLSDFQTPLPLLNSRFGASNTCNRRQISATKRGMQLANKLALSTSHLNQQHQSVNATSTQDDDRQLLLDSYSYANAPSNTQELVHKGFYRREGEESVEENHLPLNGARSFSRVSNGNNVDVYGDEADEEEARSSGTDTGATRANNNDEQLDIHNFQTSNVPDDAGLERSAWCRRRTVHVNELVAGNEDCTNRISNGRGSSGGCGHQHRQRHRQTNQNARANNQAGFSRDDSSIQYTNYSQGTNTQQLIKNQSLHVPAWYNQPAYQQHLHHHRKQQQQQQQQKQERQEHQLEQPHHFHRIIPKIRSHSHCQSQSQSQSQPQSNCQSQSNSQSSSVHPHSTNAMHQNQLSFPFPSHQYQSATLAGQTCTCNQVLTLPSNATTTPKATTTSSSLTNAIQRLSLANLNLKANLSPYTTPMLLNNSTSTLAIGANKSKKGSAKGSSVMTETATAAGLFVSSPDPGASSLTSARSDGYEIDDVHLFSGQSAGLDHSAIEINQYDLDNITFNNVGDDTSANCANMFNQHQLDPSMLL